MFTDHLADSTLNFLARRNAADQALVLANVMIDARMKSVAWREARAAGAPKEEQEELFSAATLANEAITLAHDALRCAANTVIELS